LKDHKEHKEYKETKVDRKDIETRSDDFKHIRKEPEQTPFYKLVTPLEE